MSVPSTAEDATRGVIAPVPTGPLAGSSTPPAGQAAAQASKVGASSQEGDAVVEACQDYLRGHCKRAECRYAHVGERVCMWARERVERVRV